MVDGRAHVPFLLRLVSGMPVTYWEEHSLRLGDTKEQGGLEEGRRDPTHILPLESVTPSSKSPFAWILTH